MFKQHRNEALKRAHDGAVYHRDALALTLLVYAHQVETLGDIEIELDGRHLMLPADGVGRHEVELWPVECRLARRFKMLGIALFGDFSQRSLCALPHFFGAEIFLEGFRVMEGEPYFKFE